MKRRATATAEQPAAFDLQRVYGFEVPEDSLAYVFWHVTHGMMRFLNAELTPVRLTHQQFNALASLAWLARSGPVSQTQLAEFSNLGPMLISKTIRTLEAKGLVARNSDPTDTRVKRLALTARGAMLLERAKPLVEGAVQLFFKPLGPDMAMVHQALRRLLRSVQSHD